MSASRSYCCSDCGRTLVLEAGDPFVEPCPCGGRAYALDGQVVRLAGSWAIVWKGETLPGRFTAEVIAMWALAELRKRAKVAP